MFSQKKAIELTKSAFHNARRSDREYFRENIEKQIDFAIHSSASKGLYRAAITFHAKSHPEIHSMKNIRDFIKETYFDYDIIFSGCTGVLEVYISWGEK